MSEYPEYDITIKSGAEFVFTFRVKTEDGEPEDLTGKTVRAQLRATAHGYEAFDFTCTHSGAGGTVTISMSHDQTSRIMFMHGVYDVFVDEKDCVMGGKAEIIPAVTR